MSWFALPCITPHIQARFVAKRCTKILSLRVLGRLDKRTKPIRRSLWMWIQRRNNMTSIAGSAPSCSCRRVLGEKDLVLLLVAILFLEEHHQLCSKWTVFKSFHLNLFPAFFSSTSATTWNSMEQTCVTGHEWFDSLNLRGQWPDVEV